MATLFLLEQPGPAKYLEAIAVVIGALIALPIGMVTERIRYRNRLKEEIERRQHDTEKARPHKVASYLETIADALAGMVVAFEQRQIPYEFGHLFESLVQAFKEETHNALGDAHWQHLVHLRDLVKQANEIDWLIHNNAPQNPMIEGWIRDAKRSIGDLRATAVRLRLKD